jgi:hypothetical protein
MPQAENPTLRRILASIGGVLVLASMAWVLSHPDVPNWAKVFEVVIGLLLLLDVVFTFRGDRGLYVRVGDWLKRHVSGADE